MARASLVHLAKALESISKSVIILKFWEDDEEIKQKLTLFLYFKFGI